MTKQVVPKEIEADILNMEKRGEEAMKSFVKERICGSENLWGTVKKQKFFNWIDTCKKVKLKDSKGDIELKSTNSLFARLLLIAKSSRELDLEDVISEYEFAIINAIIMQPDGSVIPCNKKSELLHILEELPSHNHQEEPESLSLEHTVLVIDGMCIVNEVISTAHPKTCKELAEVFIKVINVRS